MSILLGKRLWNPTDGWLNTSVRYKKVFRGEKAPLLNGCLYENIFVFLEGYIVQYNEYIMKHYSNIWKTTLNTKLIYQIFLDKIQPNKNKTK